MLTTKAIADAKPREKQFKLHDGGGLFVLVLPSGCKTFYRRHGDGSEVRLGRFPEMGLKEARTAGLDGNKKNAVTLRVAAADYLMTQAPKRRGGFRLYQERRLADLEALMDRPIAEITTLELRAELLKVQGRTRHMAYQLRGLASRIFEHAMSDMGVDMPINPARSLAKSFGIEPHERGCMGMIDTERLPELWQAICEYGGHPTTRAALKLAAWTALRSRSLRSARWEWLQGDVLTIPAEFMKGRKAFRCPLPSQAMAEIEALRPINGGTPFILAAPNGRGPISDETMLGALKFRIGFPEQSVHGFRALFSTIVNERREAGEHGFSLELIERQLGHQMGSVRAAYARVDYLLERAAMMQAWANFIEGSPFRRPVSDAGKLAKAMQEANRLKRAEVFRRTSP